MFNREYNLYFIQILIIVFVSVGANKSCPIQVELIENKIIKLLNGDELCGCLEYKKPDIGILQKNVACELQTSISDGTISFSATSVCGCIGYATTPNKELPTYIKTNITEKIFLQPNVTLNDLKTTIATANHSEFNTTKLPLTREISIVEKNHKYLGKIFTINKETNKTGPSTIIITVENNTSTQDFINETFQTRIGLDDNITLSDKITSNSMVISFTEGYKSSISDFLTTLPDLNTVLNSTNTSIVEAIHNSNSSETAYDVVVLNTETMKNVNYTNDDEYVSPTVPSITKSESLILFSNIKNSTEIRKVNSFGIANNVSESNTNTKENVNDTNNKYFGTEKAINDTSMEKTDDIILSSLLKNGTDVHNIIISDVNKTLNNSEEKNVNSKDMNETSALTILMIEDNLNKTYIFNNTFQAPLDVNNDLSLTDEITPSSIVIHTTEKYNASTVELRITLPDLTTKLNSTSTSKPDNDTAINTKNDCEIIKYGVLESNTSKCNLTVTNVFNETFLPPHELDEDLSKLVALTEVVTSSSNTVNFTEKHNYFIQNLSTTPVDLNNYLSDISSGELDNFKKIQISNNSEVKNSVTILNNEAKANVNLTIDKNISTTAATVNASTEIFGNFTLHSVSKNVIALQNINNSLKITDVTSFIEKQKYNTTTSPSMSNIIHGSGDGANLYDDSDVLIKTHIDETKVTIKVDTNSSSTSERDTSPDNSRTIIVALLGLLLAALLVALIAFYVYTWLFERGSYDLPPMTGGNIEMGPK